MLSDCQSIAKSDVSLVDALPPELWCSIFELISIQDRGRVLLVGKHWKDLVLACSPASWSDIFMCSGGRRWSYPTYTDRGLEQLLRLSRNEDLDLKILAYTSTKAVDNLRVHLAASIPRCSHLSLIIASDMQGETMSMYANILCSASAPRLRYLRLFDESGIFNNWMPRNLVLFNDEARQLKTVAIRGDLSNFHTEQFCGVQILRFQGVTPLTTLIIKEIFAKFSQLREATFVLEPKDTILVAETQDIVIPRTVAELALMVADINVDPARLMHCFQNNQYSRITICFKSHPDPVATDNVLRCCARDVGEVKVLRMEMTARGETRSAGIDMYDKDVDFAELPRTRSRRQILGLSSTTRPDWAFSTLTHLHIGEVLFAQGIPLPSAPALVHLSLRLLSQDFQRSDGHSSVFMLPAGTTQASPIAFRCPKLRAVSFSARLGEHSYLPASMIAEFIQNQLDFDAPRICLELFGIRLVESGPIESILDLLERTNSLDVYPDSPSVWIYDACPFLVWSP